MGHLYQHMFYPNRFGMVRCESGSYTTYIPPGTGWTNRSDPNRNFNSG